MGILSQPHFHNEAAAVARLEAIIWPNGPVCPHCGGVDRITPVKGGRIGLRRCGDCRKQFTCKVKTVFEDSKVPLHLWFQAAHLLASSKKGISSHQLHRTLNVTYKTAWFMSHGLREAMTTLHVDPVGGRGKIVESDETFIGTKKGVENKGAGFGHKMVVHSLVERGGQVRSTVLPALRGYEVNRVLKKHVRRDSRLMTDEASFYKSIGKMFAEHGTVEHSAGEYVKGDAHTNTLEGYFSVFKRGMKGVYQHCGEQHLRRYVAEFDFRYNTRAKLGINDAERAHKALTGIVGKRLYYRQPA